MITTPPAATHKNLTIVCNRLKAVRDVITPPTPPTPPSAKRQQLEEPLHAHQMHLGWGSYCKAPTPHSKYQTREPERACQGIALFVDQTYPWIGRFVPLNFASLRCRIFWLPHRKFSANVCSMMASSLLIIEKDLGAAPLPWFTNGSYCTICTMHMPWQNSKEQHHSPIQPILNTLYCTFDPPSPPVFSNVRALALIWKKCPSHPCAWIMADHGPM